MNLTLPVLHLNIAFHIQANYPREQPKNPLCFLQCLAPGDEKVPCSKPSRLQPHQHSL